MITFVPDYSRVITRICGFFCGSDGKESTFYVGDLGSVLGWEDPLEGHGNPLA